MEGWLQKPSGWEEVDYRLIQKSSQCSIGKTQLEKQLKPYNQDTIFVLAGGVNEYAENHQWVIRRLDLALALYQQKPRRIICLGGGTYHKPPCLNHLGFVVHESTSCIQYLLDQGVNPKDLMREWSSYDTIANGFFSLVNFTIPINLTNALVITSDFHMHRAKEIFQWIYGLDNRSSTSLEFLSVNSLDLDSSIIEARSIREFESLSKLQEQIKKIKTLKDFSLWFFQEHKAYNCDFLVEKTEKINKKVAQSY